MTAAVANVTTSDSIIQLVTFRLQDETYGINVMQVQEVLRVSEIAPVPGAPSHVLGIVNLRGHRYPPTIRTLYEGDQRCQPNRDHRIAKRGCGHIGGQRGRSSGTERIPDRFAT